MEMENNLQLADDPGVAILKTYMDAMIKQKVEGDLTELQTAIEEQIKDAFENVKEYINMKIETVQRETVAHIDSSMSTMWENVEKEINQNIKSVHAAPPCPPVTDENFDVSADISVVESGGEEDGEPLDFKDIEAKIETKFWGKTFNRQEEPKRQEEPISDDDLVESPSKKPKPVRARKTPVKNKPKSSSKQGNTGPGRPKGSTNKTIKKDDLTDQYKNLFEEHKKLAAELEKLKKSK